LPVRKNVEIYSIDVASTPLEIKTDSTIGSGHEVYVWFRNSGNWVSAVQIRFTSPPQYALPECHYDMTNFPTNLPTATDKVWRLTFTRTSGTRIKIHCNGKEVLDRLISGSTCRSVYSSKYWDLNVERLYFDNSDTASDFYGPMIGN
jgi:hypothetical protein